MDIKQSVWVYIEAEDGKVSRLSQELLGKGRELADSKAKNWLPLSLRAAKRSPGRPSATAPTRL